MIHRMILLSCAVAVVCSACPMSRTAENESADAGQDVGTAGTADAAGAKTGQVQCEPDGVCQPIIPCEIELSVPVRVDPCPAGEDLRCLNGTCQRCTPRQEMCNGIDDDCDGHVDEGHDLDGDGFTWCGGGIEELRDCADDDPDVHPMLSVDGMSGAQEICDGKDNDCNGLIDDAPACTEAPSG